MPKSDSPIPRPPAPGTAATVHLLVGAGRAPVISADAHEVIDQPVLYLRAQVDDVPRSGTRHTCDISISGPPADVAALVEQMATAVREAGPTSEDRSGTI
jgi:hypothetical protein